MLKVIDERGELGGRARALEAAGAVLSVLGDRLAGGEPGDLAAQLPADLAGALPLQGGGEAFGVDEFDRRVAERERGRCTPERAHRHAAAVLTTVLEAVSAGERADVAAQLPVEFEDFLPPGTPLHWHGRTTGAADGSEGGTRS